MCIKVLIRPRLHSFRTMDSEIPASRAALAGWQDLDGHLAGTEKLQVHRPFVPPAALFAAGALGVVGAAAVTHDHAIRYIEHVVIETEDTRRPAQIHHQGFGRIASLFGRVVAFHLSGRARGRLLTTRNTGRTILIPDHPLRTKALHPIGLIIPLRYAARPTGTIRILHRCLTTIYAHRPIPIPSHSLWAETLCPIGLIIPLRNASRPT